MKIEHDKNYCEDVVANGAHRGEPQVEAALACLGERHAYTRAYVASTGVLPDWLVGLMKGETSDEWKRTFHKYIVAHNGKEYPTSAKTSEQAVNFVRFRLYGTRPADSLPPFSVRQSEESTITRHDGTNKLISIHELNKRLKGLAR